MFIRLGRLPSSSGMKPVSALLLRYLYVFNDCNGVYYVSEFFFLNVRCMVAKAERQINICANVKEACVVNVSHL